MTRRPAAPREDEAETAIASPASIDASAPDHLRHDTRHDDSPRATAEAARPSELELRLEALERMLATKEARVRALNARLAERDEELDRTRASACERYDRIVELERSLSWKFTRPLREARAVVEDPSRVTRLVSKKAARALVDAEWYLANNPDVRASELSPADHYVRYGRREGRAPAPTPAERARERAGTKGRHDYSTWRSRYDTRAPKELDELRSHAAHLASRPLISVIVPTYNPKPEWITAAVESLKAQIYDRWELCIADDASTDPTTRPILTRFAQQDARIKVVFREKNGHISAASNSALALATGEFVALLDHDDLLSNEALYWMAAAINASPDVQMLYSDEDKIDERGIRSSPYFKSDWNVDLFRSHNMFSHLGVYRTALLREVGGFREGFEGSQDYDLALRCSERVAASQIVHIPRVLYHWRVHRESTAHDASAKPYATKAGVRALDEHFARIGCEATAELLDFGMYRTRYALPAVRPLVSIIIPTRNSADLVQQCIDSILVKTTYAEYEILLVDNGSDDPDALHYFESLKALPRVTVIRDDRPFNYSALNNGAVSLARGEFVALVNNDIEVISPDWLSEMVSLAVQKGVGAVGARLWYPNDTLQHGGVILGLGGVAGHAHKHLRRGGHGYFGRASLIQSLSAVTAACLLVRKSTYLEVGGLDEEHLAVAFNDVDFCIRVRDAGYRNVFTPFAELYHHESATRGEDDSPKKRARFASEVQFMLHRHGKCLLEDPAYNPNLSIEHDDFSLAWPPRAPGHGPKQGRNT